MYVYVYIYVYVSWLVLLYIYIFINNSLSHTHIKNIYIHNLVLVNHKRGRSLFSSHIWLAYLSVYH